MPRREYFLGFALIGSASLFCWQATQGAKPKDEMLELYGLFVDAVEKVETNYVRPVTRRELLETALEGMLQKLDQHSTYINTSELRQFKRQIEGRFGGIGIQVEVDQDLGHLRVIAPMVGTPAYEGGILAGDVIMEIDGQSAEGMTPDKAVEVLTGRPGTDVKLNVLHEGSEDPETITITRAIIDIPSVLGDRRKPDDRWELMIDQDKKIGYIRVTAFNEHTADELKKALDQLKDEGVKGLIVDLRDDPGGLLSSAVDISDMFLAKGEIVSTKGRNILPRKYEAHADGPFEDLPMVVLINQYSASASEILAAALQDHKRAAIVGQRSYGKGSVQNIIDLDGGNSVLKLTVASYYRPSGENIHRFPNAKPSDKWGVSPDKGLEVKLAPSEFMRWFVARQERDRDSMAKGHRKPPAAEKGKTAGGDDKPQAKPDGKSEQKKGAEKAPAKRKSARPAGGPFLDKQLDKALEVIRARMDGTKAKAA
ncbi:MAG: S41 family peptidase [Isosphaerales bacterium]